MKLALYRDRVPAGIVVGNGYGKLMGSTQVHELGEIETPIVLTNTLAVPRAADAILDRTLADPANHDVVSINPLVGETNDSYLNDIRARTLTAAMIGQVILQAQDERLEKARSAREPAQSPLAGRAALEVARGYCLAGTGQVWRSGPAEAEITDLAPGTCSTIPVGTQFQFRATGAKELHLLIATMPPWPGAHEALPVAGYWDAS